jgi:hypothetical protein
MANSFHKLLLILTKKIYRLINKARPQIRIPLPEFRRSYGLPERRSAPLIMSWLKELAKVFKPGIILRIPELIIILLMVAAYLWLLPNILREIRDSDLIRFVAVLILVSAVVAVPCILLIIQHATRIAQEEVRKSRVLLTKAIHTLIKSGLPRDSIEELLQ